LHYINIPLEAESVELARDCPGKCIIRAIADNRRVLANPASSAIEKSEALRFLIHFMGDLHQPLHVADRNDRGGNQTQVRLGARGTNLHAAWDGEIIKSAGLTAEGYYQRLTRQMASLDLASFEQGSVTDWAMEGHAIAVAQAYNGIRSGATLSQEYQSAALPVMDLAIIKAGVRLAYVLNEALANYTPSVAGPALAEGVYSDREAAAHAGETATVEAIVVSVKRVASGNIYLNFGADYPHQTFSGAILGKYVASFPGVDSLVGKPVRLTGLIRIYKGQAEMLLERPEQIAFVR
jgi:hypothetical protein